MTQPEMQLVPGTPTPILVYNRIAANRRNTRLLVAAFVAILLPITYSVCQLVAPGLIFNAVAGVIDDQAQRYRRDARAEIMLAEMMLAVTVGTVVIAYLKYWSTSNLLLDQVDARRVSRDKHQNLCRIVENLCIGAGLPQPNLFIVQSQAPNALAVGGDPRHASLVVTSGLLSLLSQRELTGVIAHELSHIGNYDTRLTTMLAALVAMLRFPLKVGISMIRLMTQSPRIAIFSLLVGLPFLLMAGFLLVGACT